MEVTLGELAVRFGCELRGDPSARVDSVGALSHAGARAITFLANPKYVAQLKETRAGAVILDAQSALQAPVAALVAANPHATYARVATLLHPDPPLHPGIHPQASVAPGAQVDASAEIAAQAFVGEGARIGARTILHSHVSVGRFAEIGADCLIHAQVSIRERVTLGDRVVLQDGVVIGADGYGFARRRDGSHEKIPQIGRVVVEDDVEIGANTTVDRPAVGETRIGAGSKIDNLVQVAHGVQVGKNVLLAAQVGVAGSAVIEDQVILAGQVGVVGHLTIGKGTVATAQTGIPHSVDPGSSVSGSPAIPTRDWLKASAVFRRLPELRRVLSELERRVTELEKE